MEHGGKVLVGDTWRKGGAERRVVKVAQGARSLAVDFADGGSSTSGQLLGRHGWHLVNRPKKPTDHSDKMISPKVGEIVDLYDANDFPYDEEDTDPPEATPAGTDPKAKYSATKPGVAVVPSAGQILAALAGEDGVKKYGFYEYRKTRVEVMTYAHAAVRHLQAWIDGEDFTSDTGVPNLGAVICCCAIILDTMACGTAEDNRPAKGRASELQDAAKEWKKAVAAGENPAEAAKKHLAPAMGLKGE